MLENRAAPARDILERNGLEALVVTHLPNIRYLCGFTGSDGVLVVTAGGSCFLTDSRYTTQARREVGEGVREYRVKLDGLGEYLCERGVRRIGFEAQTLAYDTALKLQEKGPKQAEWVPLTREIADLRAAKDAGEIDRLVEATRLNAEALESVLPLIRPGIRERDLALELEFALKRRGAEEKAFDFIVASGKRGALPHGVASDKAIAAGELVTIDFGVRWEGYHSDETVTLALGEPRAELRTLFDTVLEAHDRALERVRDGVPLREIDGVARDHIARAGFGDYFGHGLGHGVGLEVHEFPALSPRAEEVAREGMVFTIEPGIYVPDFGGVRIEDMVEVTADGFRLLTRIPKGYRRLPT